MPDLELFMIEQNARDYFFTHDTPKARVTKHLRHIHCEVIQKFLNEGRLNREFSDKRFQCHRFQFEHPQDPALERGHRIIPEIIIVLMVDQFSDLFQVRYINVLYQCVQIANRIFRLPFFLRAKNNLHLPNAWAKSLLNWYMRVIPD